MERLTDHTGGLIVCGVGKCDGDCDRCNYLTEALERLAKYEDIGTVKQFAEWKQANDEGRLVVLPVAMHSIVFLLVTRKTLDTIHRVKNSHTFIKQTELLESNYFDILRRWGKTAFATRTEAEAALERKGQDES